MRRRDGQIVGTAFCEACNKTTSIMLVDGGFAYEFWGARGYKDDWSFACAECSEEVSQDSVEFYEEDVPEPDERDFDKLEEMDLDDSSYEHPDW